MKIESRTLIIGINLCLSSAVCLAYNFPCADACVAVGTEWRPALGSSPDTPVINEDNQLWGVQGPENPDENSPIYSGSVDQSYLYVYSYGVGALVAGEFAAYGSESSGSSVQITLHKKKVKDFNITFSTTAEGTLKKLVILSFAGSASFNIHTEDEQDVTKTHSALQCEIKQVWKFPLSMVGSSTLSWDIYEKKQNFLGHYYYASITSSETTATSSSTPMGEADRTYKKCDPTVL